MLKRYDMEHDYSVCCYEGDIPYIVPEETAQGEWVRFSDVEKLFTDFLVDAGFLNAAKKSNSNR